MKINKIKEYLDFDKIKKHLDKNNNFSSLSQFRSSLFEIIDEARSKKKPDFLLYRLLKITNFKSIIAPYSPLSKKLFIFIVNLFYSKDKKEYETLKCIIYKSFKVNTKYYGIEEDEAADLLASSQICSIKYNYKLPFGKYKGVLLRNIMKDTKGKDYINYCKDKYMNDDSYEQYNTFIKIIFDRKTQLLRDKNFK